MGRWRSTTPSRLPPAPRNLFDIVGKSLRLEGFLVRDHVHLQSELEDFLVPHIRSGHVVPDETVASMRARVNQVNGAFYEAGVESVRASIAHGDIYQANLTRRQAGRLARS